MFTYLSSSPYVHNSPVLRSFITISFLPTYDNRVSFLWKPMFGAHQKSVVYEEKFEGFPRFPFTGESPQNSNDASIRCPEPTEARRVLRAAYPL